MSSIPRDELLSAYLDGELSAAERAEAERLLAADPKARRRFEEWKAMSAAIQSLPQEKFGRDISRQVLRTAERRMLTEGAPQEIAEPLMRRILQRAKNPHTLVWLSLTAAIVVMIAVYERQNLPTVKNVDKEIAFSAKSKPSAAPPESSATAKKEPYIAPRIQAAPQPEKNRELGRGVASHDTRESLRDDAASDRLPKAKMPDSGLVGQSLPAAKSADLPRREVLEKSKAPGGRAPGADTIAKDADESLPREQSGLDSKVAEKPQAAEPGGGLVYGAGMKKAGPAGEPRRAGKAADGMSDKAGWHNRQSAEDSAELVVYCDISPEAARNKAFDKLLDANGIKWRRLAEQGEKRPADTPLAATQGRAELRLESGKTDAYGKNLAQGKGRYKQQEAKLEESVANEEVICVEATPAQVQAALAGLAAQPDVFLAVSVNTPAAQAGVKSEKSENGIQGRMAVREEALNRKSDSLAAANSQRAEQSKDEKQRVAQNAGDRESKQFAVKNVLPSAAQAPPSNAAAPTTPPAQTSQATQQLATAPALQQQQGRAQVQAEGQAETQPPARQRVVFVLRVSNASVEAARVRANAAAPLDTKPADAQRQK